MTWADWAIIAILAISCLVSVVRGFVKEAMSLLIWFAAAIIAVTFHDNLAVLLSDTIATPSLRYLSAWSLLFIAVLITGGILNYLLGKLVEATGLSGTDRLLGMVFGLLRGAIIILVLLIFAQQLLPVSEDLWWRDSALIPHFVRFEGWARETGAAIFEFFKELI